MHLAKLSAFQSIINHKASILLISLWTLCLLAIFAVHLGYGVRQKISLVKRLQERNKLRFIAEAGIKKAFFELRKRPAQEYYTLIDALSDNPALFKDVRVGDGSFSICYEHIDSNSGASSMRYGLIDEERKININIVDKALLEQLFISLISLDEDEAQELAASIVDWRDADSELSIPLGSAEDSYYKGLSYSYEAKDASFEVLEELLLVKGMTEDIFDKIKNYITIYGEGKININTVSANILLALGLSQDIVDGIISFRCGEDTKEGTADDNIIVYPPNIVPKLSQFFHLNDSELAQLTAVSNQYLATHSNNFTIRSIARLDGRDDTTEVICVVDQDEKILYHGES